MVVTVSTKSFGGALIEMIGIDGDGKITTADASLILSNAYYLTSVDPSNAYDVNGDGSITTADASIILSVKSYLKTAASDCTVDFGA